MAIVLDESTRAEYLAQTLASSRASGIVSALGSTVYVEVYDSANTLRASGTMASPWATSSGATVTVGEVNAAGIYVTTGGVPDSLWYCQFRGSNGRFVRGTFGVSGSGMDFTWSLSTFQTGSKGTIGTATFTAGGVADAVLPTIATAQTISGTATVGQVLTSSSGSWNNQPTSFAVQWQRASSSGGTYSDISGATSFTYTLTSSDQGQYVRSKVTASNAAGTSLPSYSNVLGAVAAAPVATAAPLNYGVPLLLGAPEVGQTLTLQNSVGDWLYSPTSYASTWQRSDDGVTGWADISGAPGDSYTLTSSDLTKYVRRRTVATNSQGSTAAVSGAMGPVQAASTKSLLSAADFTYVGYYDVSVGGSEQVYYKSLALRKVAGDVRFILHINGGTGGHFGGFVEFSLSGKTPTTLTSAPTSAQITTTTQSWAYSSVVGSTEGMQEGAFWDAANSRLWLLRCISYPDGSTGDGPFSTNIRVLELGSGVVASGKTFSAAGVYDRRAWSGALAVPSSLQTDYGFGPYVIGFGGYASREDVAGGAAIGPSLFSIPNPIALANGAEIPAGQVKTLATRGTSPRGRTIYYGSAFVADGGTSGGTNYNAPTGTIYGKGPINYQNSGQDRENPSTPPNYMPIPSAQNTSPDTYGHGVMSFNFRYRGGFMLDSTTKRGAVLLGRLGTGKQYYMSSGGYADGQMIEAHIYDPQHLYEVTQGTRAANSIKPVAMRALTETHVDEWGGSSDCGDSFYDAETGRLYVWVQRIVSPFHAKLHVYQVSA